jgi:acetyltransferase-like isoleucine patch superfamily enzyme
VQNHFRTFFDLRLYAHLFRRLRQFIAREVIEFERLSPGRYSHDPVRQLRSRKDITIDGHGELSLGEESYVSPGAELIFPRSEAGESAQIQIGRNAAIGRRVLLQVYEGNKLQIDDYTTVQDNSIILGDVHLERHCILAPNVYISSGNHYATARPAWLIRDQDALVLNDPVTRTGHSQPVHIEEDCWLGIGVFVGQGIYIGRGAVIGAHTVVTRDVPPYSIQVGSPNKEINKRLTFEPPSQIDAANEQHWPYFYSGFQMRQANIQQSKNPGALLAHSLARAVLAGGEFRELIVKGILCDGATSTSLAVTCNGCPLGTLEIHEQRFESRMITNQVRLAEAGVLKDFNQLAFEVRGDTRSTRYGISTIAIIR